MQAMIAVLLSAGLAVMLGLSSPNLHAHVGEPILPVRNASWSGGDVNLLASIVGQWQSDTTAGFSARSTCTWTPHHGGVVCEQLIVTPNGPRTAVSIFVPDSSADQFVLYVLTRGGESLAPVALNIRGNTWTYGGGVASSDGQFYRTVNDFSRTDVYAWRQESSKNGTQWTEGLHGLSRRIR